MLLELVWLTVLGINILPFGLYILYMKRVAMYRPWNIKIDPEYEPAISVIIPTYDEESTIKRKLDNIAEADYPKEKLELIIVDSASRDKTVSIAREWSRNNDGIKTQIVCQSERKGMINALNEGLKYVHGEVVVKTDADCLWLKNSLRSALKYLPDAHVGSVAGLHMIDAQRATSSVTAEKTYREFYRWLRVGESKLYSTVLYEGELMLIKRDIISAVGFDESIGADDVPTALKMAELGHRAITAEDAFFIEQTPYTWNEKFHQKIRRGRHVFQALWKYKYLNFNGDTPLHRLILPFETYIYLVNPIITGLLIVASAFMIIRYPWLMLFFLLLINPKVRELFLTHLTDSTIMMASMLMEATGREKVTWTQVAEIRANIPMGRY